MSSSRNYNPGWQCKASECFDEWNKLFYQWKTFRRSQRNLLLAYVGLPLFGTPSEVADLENIWYKFKKDQREIIVKIVDKFKFGTGCVSVGHTYLYLDTDDVVCVFRQMKSTNEIIFIDCNGRVYKSWQHFRETNQLPDCRYMAPVDGLHKVNQTCQIYESPAAGIGRDLQTADTMAAGCTMVALGLMGLAMAPATATVLGTIGTVYAVGRSIGVLDDRNEHEESIGLDNAQSVLSWATITTSAVTGVSGVALARSAQIVEKSGNFANVAKAALKGLSYASLTANICNFGTYVYCLQQKVASGEKLTTFDLMEGCVNLFLIAGAVSNTRQMNKYISSLETAPKTTGARLTRTAKRRLQRLRAKLRRANGGNVPVNADVKQVTTLEENIPSWGLSFVLNSGQQFLTKHINIQHIYYKCLEILNTCNDFRLGKIPLIAFASNMINHLQNLYIIVTDAIVSTKSKVESFLKRYFHYSHTVSTSVTDQISHMVENAKTTVKQVDDKLMELIEDEEEQQSSETESKPNYEIIFNVAKNRIPQSTQTSEIICSFSAQLSSLISEIITELNDNYEEWVSMNIETFGKTEADRMFSENGINTLNDFANLNFIRIMENKNDTVKVNRNIANDETMQKVWILCKTVLSKAATETTLAELGALATCKMLKKSIVEVFIPLGEKFKSAKKLYEMNVSFVGPEKAKNMVLSSLKVNQNRSCVINNSTLFDLAAEKLSLDEIASELSEVIKGEKETNKISSLIIDDEDLLSLCDKFYQKVKSISNTTTDSYSDREETLKNCYHFSMEKFVKLFKTKEEEVKTKTSDFIKLQNDQFFDRRRFAIAYRKACEMRKHEMFASVVEYFTEENHLTSLAEEYIAKNKGSRNRVAAPVCSEINEEEDGVRMFSIDEGCFLNVSAYKRQAASLFGLNEYEMKLEKWENGSVILKCGYYKYVAFQNVDVKSMMVMEVDTSKDRQLDFY
ncbi:uncharacterized protein LOC135842434 [Planococcus citri]|uniref:uncharacterized protein LOC135842434 n=1 Tax=Planococcus citri TaxID=170843 RepID=UPI0031F80EBD